MLLVISIKD